MKNNNTQQSNYSTGIFCTIHTIVIKIAILLVLISSLGIHSSYAGTLIPPGAPTKTMYTLSDIFNLSAGATTSIGSGPLSATPGSVSSTFKTLTEIYNAITSQISNLTNTKIAKDVSAFGFTGTLLGDTDGSKVLSSATYPGTILVKTSDNPVVNTTVSGTSLMLVPPAGYYDGVATVSTTSSNFIAGNIKSGTTLFGITGTLELSLPYGDASDASKVLTTASTPGTFDATFLTVGNVRNGVSFGSGQIGSYAGGVGWLFGSDNATKVLTTADSAGTYDASSLSPSTVKSGTTFGVGQTGTVIESVGTAIASNVLSGTTFSNTGGANISGTMPTNTLSPLNDIVSTGYYSATNLATVDTDLTAGNIKSGTTIFGVAGSLTSLTYGDNAAGNVLSSASAPGTYDASSLSPSTVKSGTTFGVGQTGTMYPSTQLKTGQTTCWNASGGSIACTGTGQDGDTLKGQTRSYTDNANGTVTDNNTGLIWQKQDNATMYTWANAITYCNTNTATLPGSGWRLPNVFELFSLVDFTVTSSAKINNSVFPSTQSGYYWSATTYPDTGNQQNATNVVFYGGYVYDSSKSVSNYVRCVR